jgi:hypothetical protein
MVKIAFMTHQSCKLKIDKLFRMVRLSHYLSITLSGHKWIIDLLLLTLWWHHLVMVGRSSWRRNNHYVARMQILPAVPIVIPAQSVIPVKAGIQSPFSVHSPQTLSRWLSLIPMAYDINHLFAFTTRNHQRKSIKIYVKLVHVAVLGTPYGELRALRMSFFLAIDC